MIWNWKNTVTSENQDAAALQETLRRPRSRTYTEAEVAAREAAAAAREREACALIAAERGAWASNDADAESLVDRLEARGRMDMASEIAAAIRARGKEVGGE